MKNSKSTRFGFTLIELLVVVLIIGILAAVALPQYQAAVLKSRLTAFLPLLQNIKNAQERYFMENGEYAAFLTDLDIELPSLCEMQNTNRNMFFCGDEWYINNVISYLKPHGRVILYYCPGNTDRINYSICMVDKIVAEITFYYDNKTEQTDRPEMLGKKTCSGTTDLSRKVCKKLLN